MVKVLEEPHDGDCPFCRSEIDGKAVVCRSCGAEKITVDDGPGVSSAFLSFAGTIVSIGGGVFAFFALIDALTDGGVAEVVGLVICILVLAVGFWMKVKAEALADENRARTAREAWKHVSAGDVVAASERAEQAAEEAKRAASSAEAQARKTASRSFWDNLDTKQ